MKVWTMAGVLIVLGLTLACSPGEGTEMKVAQLRCEYLKNPLGIDVAHPRLSWVLESNVRGQKQTAYRIIVASGEENLNKNKGDLWDTGKVKSDRSNQVVYEGKNLHSSQRCYWKVCVWDKDGAKSDFSTPALWTMGLLKDDDWKASWIAMERRPISGKPKDLAPGPPPPWFRKTFALDKPVKRATVYITARGIYRLRINGNPIGDDVFAPEWTDYNKRIQYRTYDVTSALKHGNNAVGAIVGRLWPQGAL